MPLFTGVHSGYSTRIQQLKPDDVVQFQLQEALGDVPWEECIAVWGEDLGECLAAVVHAKKDAPKPLLWSDADGDGTAIANDFQFADAVMVVTLAIHSTIAQIVEDLG